MVKLEEGMIIAELGLRPCLMEEFPNAAEERLKTIDKIEKRIDQSNYLKSRKKRLRAKLANLVTES